MKHKFAAAALAIALVAGTPALAQSTDVVGRGYTLADTSIGTLLDDADAKAIVDKYMPGFSSNPQVDMARSMTFKQIQSFAPDQMSDDVLGKISADLAKLPPKK